MLKNKYIISTLFAFNLTMIFAQTTLSDLQQLATKDLDAIKNQLNDPSQDIGSALSTENSLPENSESVAIVDIPVANNENQLDYFGYDYFNRDISFVENIPTPNNYILGPGDEIILSLWGETNSRERFLINKNGTIYYEKIGFIDVAGKNVNQIQTILTGKLAEIYSTLDISDGRTRLSVDVEAIKSINVFFSGEINQPGLNVIHPFSDVFTAIIQAGGVTNNASLRNIQLIRDGSVIKNIDFYAFFLEGNISEFNMRILDGDIVHIPFIDSRVKIQGPINKEGWYELLSNETLQDLISFAGGLSFNASSSIRWNQYIPYKVGISSDLRKKVSKIDAIDYGKIKPNNGDIFTVYPIRDFNEVINIFGRVKSPGEYPARISLKEALDLAGGFSDFEFSKSIFKDEIKVLRKTEDVFNKEEFILSYDNSSEFILIPGDEVYVYQNTLYNSSYNVSISGEVQKVGTYQVNKNVSVADLISIAGGFTELAQKDALILKEKYVTINNDGTENIDELLVNNVSLKDQLAPGSELTVLPKSYSVNVAGNVYNPGLIQFKDSLRLKEAIVLAGGFKRMSKKNNIIIKRLNGQIKTYGRWSNPRLLPGDTITVPVREESNFDVTAFTADILIVLTNIAAILNITSD